MTDEYAATDAVAAKETTTARIRRRRLHLAPAIILIAVCSASYALLLFVGQAEIQRRHLGLVGLRLQAAAQQFIIPIQQHLDAGSSLSSYAGFQARADALLRSDQAVLGIAIHDRQLQPLDHLQSGTLPAADHLTVLPDKWQVTGASLARDENAIVLSAPIRSRFGNQSTIDIAYDRDAVERKERQAYLPIFWVALGALACVAVASLATATASAHTRRWLAVLIAAGFLTIGATGLWKAVTLYQNSIDGTAAISARTLAERIGVIEDLGLAWNDIGGVDESLAQILENDPNIAAIHIADGDNLLAKAGVANPSQQWHATATVGTQSTTKLHILLNMDLVWQPIRVGIRAFIVLLVACGLMATIVIEAGTAIEQSTARFRRENKLHDGLEFKVGLRLVKPAYFLIIVVNCLSVAFLPQVVIELAAQTNLSVSWASLPFTLYYLFFALAMIPAGRLVSKYDLRKFMVVGCCCEFIGLVLIATTADFWLLSLARSLSGIGQGVFLIGLQSYLLAITPTDRRTQGNAVKVVAKNAGSIAGAAIGALLFAYADYHTIFWLASGISLAVMAYVLGLVPPVSAIASRAGTQRLMRSPTQKRHSTVGGALRDGEFMRTLLLIGLTSKMTITGVVMFAGPLILERAGFVTESIGQTLMLYYICSMVTTQVIARVVDKQGSTRGILVLSTIVGGLGIVLLGSLADLRVWQDTTSGWATPLYTMLINTGGQPLIDGLLVFGMALTGISFGISAAPLITHITRTPIAQSAGTKQASATYTLLERSGHVLGPIVVSQLFIFVPQGMAIAIFGTGMLILGVCFKFSARTM